MSDINYIANIFREYNLELCSDMYAIYHHETHREGVIFKFRDPSYAMRYAVLFGITGIVSAGRNVVEHDIDGWTTYSNVKTCIQEYRYQYPNSPVGFVNVGIDVIRIWCKAYSKNHQS
jgi:hypothetical protein